MRYADHLDYLVAAITALGSHEEYWSRRSEPLSKELGLEHSKLDQVLRGFPGIFRRVAVQSNNQDWFSLQKRYAMRPADFGKTKSENIRPLTADELNQILEFVFRAAQMETEATQNKYTNRIAVGAAIVSALAAIIVAVVET